MRMRVGPYSRSSARRAAVIVVVAFGACGPARSPETPAPAAPVPPADVPEAADAARAEVQPVAVEPRGVAVKDRKGRPLGETPLMRRPAIATARGEATYYANELDGRRTASGIVFRNSQAYAAHRTYPFGTVLRVTNTRNERKVIVRVVDRGPHGKTARARRTIIDLSRSSAARLGFIGAGRTPVLVEVLEWGDGQTAW